MVNETKQYEKKAKASLEDYFQNLRIKVEVENQ